LPGRPRSWRLARLPRLRRITPRRPDGAPRRRALAARPAFFARRAGPGGPGGGAVDERRLGVRRGGHRRLRPARPVPAPRRPGGLALSVLLRPRLPLAGAAPAVPAGPGTLLRRFTGYTGSVWAVTFSPGGGRILSGSLDGTLRLWDRATGGELRCLSAHAEGV